MTLPARAPGRPGFARAALTVARREIASMLRTPTGWLLGAGVAAFAGLVFVGTTLAPGEPASLRTFFVAGSWLMVVLAPAISMRTLSDEIRSGSAELLATSPASDAAIVLGKYLGAVGVLLLMLLPTLAMPIALWLIASPAPDVGPIVAGYAGLVLAGMCYLAVGLCASALTSSQTLAFLSSFLLLIAWVFVTGDLASRGPDWAASLGDAMSVSRRIRDFARGLVVLEHGAFFLGIALWFVVAAGAITEARRWR